MSDKWCSFMGLHIGALPSSRFPATTSPVRVLRDLYPAIT